MRRRSFFYTRRFALLVWLIAGLAAVTANISLESAQDWSAAQVLTDAQDGPNPNMGPDLSGDEPLFLQQAFNPLPRHATLAASLRAGDIPLSNAPRKGWQGRAPPAA